MKKAILATCLTLSIGCGNKAKEQPAPPAQNNAQPAAAAETKKGLEAADNDKDVLELVKAALGCPVTDNHFKWDCPEYKAFSESKLLDQGKNDRTLVNLLEDPSDNVRRIAVAGTRRSRGYVYGRDKALAERVVAVAESEKTIDLQDLGGAVGDIKVKPTDTWPRIKALLETGSDKLKIGILGNVLFNNSDEDEVFEKVRAMAEDPTPAIRRAALNAFWVGGHHHAVETCQTYAKHIDDADKAIAADSAYHVGRWGDRCAAHYDQLLDAVEKQSHVDDASWANGLGGVLVNKKSTEAQKKRAWALAQKIAEDTAASWTARTSIMSSMQQADAAKAAPVLTKLKGDKQKWVADKAKELLEKKQ